MTILREVDLLQGLARRPRNALAGALVLAAVVAAADAFLSAHLHPMALHVVPVAIVAWVAAPPAALLLAGLGVAWGLATDLGSLPAGVPPEAPFVDAGLVSVLLAAVVFAVKGARLSLESARDDYVTGIANGQAFLDLARVELSRARRYGRPVTAARIQLEGFRAVTDRAGHYASEALLRSVAQVLRGAVRGTDVVARLEADVFALLLPETGGEAARVALQRLHGELLADMRRTRWPVGITVAAVAFERAPEAPEGLLHATEDAMASARQQAPGAITLRSLTSPPGEEPASVVP